MQHTLEKLNKSIRLKEWLTKYPLDKDQNYNPNLYIPLRWNPPEASEEIEKSLKRIATTLKEETKKNTLATIPRSNLTKLQHTCIQKIKNLNRYIVCFQIRT
jgi:hypothetical protein